MYHANNARGYYHWYIRRIAKDAISHSLSVNDGTIPERIFKKIQWYMVEAFIMGGMLADLAGYSLKKDERKCLVYLGAIMALFDAIVDDFKFDNQRIGEILGNVFSDAVPKSRNAETAIEKVLYIYTDSLISTIQTEKWSEIAELTGKIRSQVDSAEQIGNTISEENVYRITLEKGGVSSLICSVFIESKTDGFRDAVFQTGGFIQMMNDCQDLYKDTRAGIKTFVHFCDSFNDIFSRLNVQRIKTFRQIDSLELDSHARYKMIFDLNTMFIVISYKLLRYAKACNYSLDFDLIAGMERNNFIVNPFTLNTVFNCTGKILSFDPGDYENPGAFNFSS